MNNRAVITGIGIITPIGKDKDSFWKSAREGQSGIRPITAFNTSDHKVHIGGEVLNFRPDKYFNEKFISSFGRQAQFVLAATQMAFDDSGVLPSDFDPMRVGVVIGTLFGEPVQLEELIYTSEKKGINSIDSQEVFYYPYTSVSQTISSTFEFCGPSETIYCACSSGNTAIARACDLIEMGIVDIVVAGGVDVLSVMIFSNFHDLKLLAKNSCRPFEKNRDGLVCGEGAGVLLIQSLESVRRTNQHIYAEIVGYGLSCDAFHSSAVDPEGRGICDSMKMALSDAKLSPLQIDYVSAHGTGTRMNDKIETLALKKIFGSHSQKLLVSSIKSMIGHSMGASSAIEAIACCLVLDSQIIPPTINYHEADPDCDLNYVPNNSVEYPVNICMNNSLAFGGINASLILGKCQ